MAVFPPISSPRVAYNDLRAFMRQRSREQVIGACLAVLSTIIILIMVFADSKINTATGAKIIFVDSFPANRSDAQIKADQKKDQAAQAAYTKERQRQFKTLQKQLGM